jgi:hypothetical protein
MSGLPISAEARGQLRIWLAAQEKITADILVAYRKTRRERGDFGAGEDERRERALPKLQSAYEGAGARWFGLHNSSTHRAGRVVHPIHGHAAVWGFLDHTKGGGVVMVKSIVIDDEGSRRQPWLLMCALHALGRALQRAPGTDLSAVVWDAHESARTFLDQRLNGNSFLLRSGPGGFVCKIVSHDLDKGGCLLICAKTWLAEETMHEDQERLVWPSRVVGVGSSLPRPSDAEQTQAVRPV